MTPLLSSLKAGDVLLSGPPNPSSPAPKGFMRKVTSVTPTGKGVQVATTQATIADAVSSAFIDTNQHYPDATGAVFTPADPGASLLPAGSAASTAAHVNGPLAPLTVRPPTGLPPGVSPGVSPGLPPPPPPPMGPPQLPPGPTTPIGPPPSSGLTLQLNNVVLSTGNSSGQTTTGSGDTSGNASATVTLNGWVNLDPTVFLHLDIEGCGVLCTYVHEFDAGVTLNQSADIVSNFNANGGVAYEKTVGTIELPGFATYVLYWQPVFEVKVGVSVNGQIAVSLHAVDSVSLEGGAQWNDDHMGHSGWTNLSHASANATFDVPYLDVHVTAQAYVKPQFSILLYGIVGPDVATQVGVNFDIAVPGRPFLNLNLALIQSIGVHVSVFGFWDVDYNANLPEVDIPLGKSPNIPAFILSTSPPDGTSSPLAGLQFQVNAFDLQDGTNLTYSWTDETGAVLGTAASLLAPANLKEGTHDVTVTVTDTVGAQSSATIHGVIVRPPSATLQAFLPPISQSGQSANQVSTLDTNGCLPSPELDIVGSAEGGTQPYTYSWALQPQGGGASTFSPSSTTATTATLASAEIPSNFITGTSTPVTIAFTVTDATGATSRATQIVTWTCTVVCGDAGEPCCSAGPGGSSDQSFGENCLNGVTKTYQTGGACTPGYHFSQSLTMSVAKQTYSNSSCSFLWNNNGSLDCSVTVTAFAAQFCDPLGATLECVTNVYEVQDLPAGCPGN
jgi:hypothetical protein